MYLDLEPVPLSLGQKKTDLILNESKEISNQSWRETMSVTFLRGSGGKLIRNFHYICPSVHNFFEFFSGFFFFLSFLVRLFNFSVIFFISEVLTRFSRETGRK